jgi:hypothetical protein
MESIGRVGVVGVEVWMVFFGERVELAGAGWLVIQLYDWVVGV